MPKAGNRKTESLFLISGTSVIEKLETPPLKGEKHNSHSKKEKKASVFTETLTWKPKGEGRKKHPF